MTGKQSTTQWLRLKQETNIFTYSTIHKANSLANIDFVQWTRRRKKATQAYPFHDPGRLDPGALSLDLALDSADFSIGFGLSVTSLVFSKMPLGVRLSRRSRPFSRHHAPSMWRFCRFYKQKEGSFLLYCNVKWFLCLFYTGTRASNKTGYYTV